MRKKVLSIFLLSSIAAVSVLGNDFKKGDCDLKREAMSSNEDGEKRFS